MFLPFFVWGDLWYDPAPMEKKRLSKALAAAGVASRRACEELIFAGRVTVNGKVALLPQTLVSFSHDRIAVDKKPIAGEEDKLYFLLNKPVGYICSNTRIGTKKIVLDLFGSLRSRLFTVGRLDRDTSGLLIVTNDGYFANKVIHPSSRVVKEYLVRTSQEISHDHLISISGGALIEGTWIKPVKVSKVRRGTIKVAVMEGRKKEKCAYSHRKRASISFLFPNPYRRTSPCSTRARRVERDVRKRETAPL